MKVVPCIPLVPRVWMSLRSQLHLLSKRFSWWIYNHFLHLPCRRKSLGSGWMLNLVPQDMFPWLPFYMAFQRVLPMFLSLLPRLACGFRSLFLVPSTRHHSLSETAFCSCLMLLGTTTICLETTLLCIVSETTVIWCHVIVDPYSIFLYDCQLAPLYHIVIFWLSFIIFPRVSLLWPSAGVQELKTVS